MRNNPTKSPDNTEGVIFVNSLLLVFSSVVSWRSLASAARFLKYITASGLSDKILVISSTVIFWNCFARGPRARLNSWTVIRKESILSWLTFALFRTFLAACTMSDPSALVSTKYPCASGLFFMCWANAAESSTADSLHDARFTVSRPRLGGWRRMLWWPDSQLSTQLLCSWI